MQIKKAPSSFWVVGKIIRLPNCWTQRHHEFFEGTRKSISDLSRLGNTQSWGMWVIFIRLITKLRSVFKVMKLSNHWSRFKETPRSIVEAESRSLENLQLNCFIWPLKTLNIRRLCILSSANNKWRNVIYSNMNFCCCYTSTSLHLWRKCAFYPIYLIYI